MLIGENLYKSFGGNTVLRGVNISIEPGKITTLIGPSGSGKTTLLRALSLLDMPDAGRVDVDEITYHFPIRSRTKVTSPWPCVTVVFQQLFLWPHLTLRQNILLPLKSRSQKRYEAYLEELITLFEMKGFIDRYPNQASLGQRQRAAIVRALALEPSYILLDEITSSLDVEQISAILTHLLTLRNKGIGILIITHLIGFARRASDQVVFLDDGMVLETGSSDMLDRPQHERVQHFLSMVETAR